MKKLIISVPLLLAVGCSSSTNQTCGTGTVNVDGTCVAVDAGPSVACGAGTVLSNGVCVGTDAGPGTTCGAGTHLVEGVCVAIDAGPGIACGDGTTLVDGLCVGIDAGPGTTCGAGTELVAGVCVGIDAGPGITCGDGTELQGGTCVPVACASGRVACGTTCVDPQTDPQYCGAGADCAANPGTVCQSADHATPICVNGGCSFACVPGYADCDGVASNGCESQGVCGGACAFRNAEHPSYTTPAQDVALCGGTYDATTMAAACSLGWHVCKLSEWQTRFPVGAPPNGELSTWGASQSLRCVGANELWEADRPVDGNVWYEDVCIDPSDATVGAYNPWNNGKFLYDEDGTTVLEGNGSCCDWDTAFDPATDTDGFAVYCCKG